MTERNMTTLPGGHKVSVPEEFREIASICRAEEVMIGGKMVLGMEDARDLHAGLLVGRDYTSWIKGRIDKYGFRDGVDYEIVGSPNRASKRGGGEKENCSPDLVSKRGGHNALTYRISLHMARELGMVENNERGRLIRRYYIWLEDAVHASSTELVRRGDGMLRMAVHKITAMERRMQAMEARWNEGAALTDPRVAVVSGMTAKEFLDKQKVPSKGRRGLVHRVSNRVLKFSAKHGYQVDFCRRTGTRVFMPRALEDWYTNGGGSLLVRAHMDALAGQRRLFPIEGGKLAA